MLVSQDGQTATATMVTAGGSNPSMADAGRSGSRDVQRLGQQLHTLFNGTADEPQLTQRFLELVCRLVGARGGLYLSADTTGCLVTEPGARLPSGFGAGALPELRALAVVAQAEGAVQLCASQRAGDVGAACRTRAAAGSADGVSAGGRADGRR